MEIIPAIDIQDGKCVRLYQGDFNQATIYSSDPLSMAQRWVDQGATRLHIVDLDGARAGHPRNTDVIETIVAAVSIPVQVGGGLRNEQDIASVLALGVERVILGTVAVRDPGLVARAIERFEERIIIGVDARNGWVATAGWTELSETHAVELVNQMVRVGVQRIVYTDIARDGTLTEPNYAATQDLIRPEGPAIIASGGISHTDHLVRLAHIGVEGAIVGRALYTGAIELSAALTALKEGENRGSDIIGAGGEV